VAQNGSTMRHKLAKQMGKTLFFKELGRCTAPAHNYIQNPRDASHFQSDVPRAPAKSWEQIQEFFDGGVLLAARTARWRASTPWILCWGSGRCIA